tara:strand:- start:2338 stop:2874 length:537 start_codon:yes stop_codon:yes gene_type:complete
MKLFDKLPIEIIREKIIPYTYEPQPKEVLEDIISYYEVKNLLKDYYINMSKLYHLTSAQERFKIHIAEFLKIYNLKEIRERSFNYYNKEKREQNLMNLLFEENPISVNFILPTFSRFNISLRDLTESIKNPIFFFGLLTTYERFKFLMWVYDENKFHKNSLLQNIFDYIEKNNLRNIK